MSEELKTTKDKLVEALRAALPRLGHIARGNYGEDRYNCDPKTCPKCLVESAIAQLEMEQNTRAESPLSSKLDKATKALENIQDYCGQDLTFNYQDIEHIHRIAQQTLEELKQ